MTKSEKIEVLKAKKEEASNLHDTMINYFVANKEMLIEMGMCETFLCDCASSQDIADNLQAEIEELEADLK